MNTYIISTANVIPAKSTDYNGFTVLFMFNQLTRTIIYNIHMCELIYVTESADLDVWIGMNISVTTTSLSTC